MRCALAVSLNSGICLHHWFALLLLPLLPYYPRERATSFPQNSQTIRRVAWPGCGRKITASERGLRAPSRSGQEKADVLCAVAMTASVRLFVSSWSTGSRSWYRAALHRLFLASVLFGLSDLPACLSWIDGRLGGWAISARMVTGDVEVVALSSAQLRQAGRQSVSQRVSTGIPQPQLPRNIEALRRFQTCCVGLRASSRSFVAGSSTVASESSLCRSYYSLCCFRTRPRFAVLHIF